MWAITKREFWNLIKSVRALIIILLFSAGSIWVTNSLSKVSGQLDVEEYYASLRFFPYFYLLQGVEFMGVPMIFSTLITWVAVLLVKGRDY